MAINPRLLTLASISGTGARRTRKEYEDRLQEIEDRLKQQREARGAWWRKALPVATTIAGTALGSYGGPMGAMAGAGIGKGLGDALAGIGLDESDPSADLMQGLSPAAQLLAQRQAQGKPLFPGMGAEAPSSYSLGGDYAGVGGQKSIGAGIDKGLSAPIPSTISPGPESGAMPTTTSPTAYGAYGSFPSAGIDVPGGLPQQPILSPAQRMQQQYGFMVPTGRGR